MSIQRSGLAFLNGLKVANLQNIARLTGVSPSGTKTELQARLNASLTHGKLALRELEEAEESNCAQDKTIKSAAKGPQKADYGQNGTYRILSIDMGIRNLAFCTLELDRKWLLPEGQSALVNSNQGRSLSLPLTQPRVRVGHWHRLALAPDSGSGTLHGDPSSSARAHDSETDVESETPTGAIMPTLTKELFSPPHLAPLAWSVVSSLVLQQKTSLLPSSRISAFGSFTPDTILIERQRWRSGGGSAVLEWTLRVNSLEAMLWSSLQTLRALGVWRGQVHAVDPRTVARFWVPDAKELTGRKGKEAKIGVAKGLIAGKEQAEGAGQMVVDWYGHAVKMKQAFAAAGTKGKQGLKPNGKLRKGAASDAKNQDDAADEQAVTVSKRDDLADCLLQGLAWVKWEENRRTLLAKGIV